MTQTWLADEVADGDRLTYEPVFCLACSQQHFICTATGRALGDSAAAVTATRGPAFPPKAFGRDCGVASNEAGIVPSLPAAAIGGARVKVH